MEQYFTEFSEQMASYLNAEKIGFVNLQRQKDVYDAYRNVCKIVLKEDPDAEIEFKQGALQDGSVSIRVTTYAVTVFDIATFFKAVHKANNFEIYPTADDRVKFDILFDGVIEYHLL